MNNKKYCLYGVNVGEERSMEFAEVLGCQVGRFPFVYLGVKVGSVHRKVVEWENVVQQVRNRVIKWENLNISFGGRRTLLNVVLSSLPVFYLSTYRAPKTGLSEITKIQRSFFWGGGIVNVKKIPWVEWKTICMLKFHWGLGVRELECFNRVLLGKWT